MNLRAKGHRLLPKRCKIPVCAGHDHRGVARDLLTLIFRGLVRLLVRLFGPNRQKRKVVSRLGPVYYRHGPRVVVSEHSHRAKRRVLERDAPPCDAPPAQARVPGRVVGRAVNKRLERGRDEEELRIGTPASGCRV